MNQLLVLHWGQVEQFISVTGVDPSSGDLTASPSAGNITPETGSGRIKPLKGRGGSKGVSGSS